MPTYNDDHHDDALDDGVLRVLLEGVAPAALSADAIERSLGFVLQGIREPFSHLRPPITVRADEGEWIRIAPKVEMKILQVDRIQRTQTILLRLQPGAKLPSHEHEGDEDNLMLEGECTWGDLTIRAGDYHAMPKGTRHGAITSSTGALVYVRGALTIPEALLTRYPDSGSG